MNTKTTKANKINKIKRKTNNLNRKINRIQKQVKNVKRRNRRQKGIPAANTKRMNRDFQILYQDGNTVKVTGRDLVYKIPETIEDQQSTGVITVIPANPCYWIGTRIAALAQGYQNYRPLAMKFTYIPQCAVTQQGNVIAGTLWNQAPSNDNLQQSLRTSNGGQLSQCYKGFTSVVRLRSNLQYNLYKTAGQFDQESNPFIYMAIAVSCLNTENKKIIPGYFYVTWSFLLKNPIGNTNIFYNSGIKNYKYVQENATYENKTIVYLQPDTNDIQMGAIIQIENDSENEVQAYYNGSYYDIQDTDKIWYFANSTIQQTNALAKEMAGKMFYGQIITPEQDQWIASNYYFREVHDNDQLWMAFLYFEERSVQFKAGRTYYYYGNEVTLSTIGYWLEHNYIMKDTWVFGNIHRPIIDNDTNRVIGFSFVVPKHTVQIEEYNPNNKTINKNKTALKIPKIKTLQIEDEAEQVCKVVTPEEVLFPKSIKQKSAKIKKQLIQQQDEFDQYSASDLFN